MYVIQLGKYTALQAQEQAQPMQMGRSLLGEGEKSALGCQRKRSFPMPNRVSFAGSSLSLGEQTELGRLRGEEMTLSLSSHAERPASVLAWA